MKKNNKPGVGYFVLCLAVMTLLTSGCGTITVAQGAGIASAVWNIARSVFDFVSDDTPNKDVELEKQKGGKSVSAK